MVVRYITEVNALAVAIMMLRPGAPSMRSRYQLTQRVDDDHTQTEMFHARA